MLHPHVSGYFLIRNFFFPDTAIVHTHTANSQANPEIFESALQSGNFQLNPITFRIRVDGRIQIFSDTTSSQNWRQYLLANLNIAADRRQIASVLLGLIFSLLACMQLNVALLNAEISYARRWLDICKPFTLTAGRNNLNE